MPLRIELAASWTSVLSPREIAREMENVRAAVNWASQHWEAQAARKVLVSLSGFYIVQGWHEGKDEFRDIARLRRETLLARNVLDPSKDQVLMSARIHQAFLRSNLGQIDESEQFPTNAWLRWRSLG